MDSTSEVGRVGTQRTVQVVDKKETSFEDKNLLATVHKDNDPFALFIINGPMQ